MLANENQDIKKALEKLEYVSSDRDERFRIDQIDIFKGSAAIILNSRICFKVI